MNTTINSATEEINAFQHMLHPSAMRAYFAAHAPDVPHWFNDCYEPQDLERDAKFDTDAYDAQERRNKQKRDAAWKVAFFAWRLFYADQMIAALEAK